MEGAQRAYARRIALSLSALANQWLLFRVIGMEKEILSATEEQRDSIKTETVRREETGIPFHHFQPHDDWKPEPPKPKDEKPNPKKEAEIDRFPLPHSLERRLTPREVQAIKDMRANPHIPEDAKPPLPEGY